MHAVGRTDADNPNTWTPAGLDVRRALTALERTRATGRTPDSDHLDTLIRAAVAFIDLDSRRATERKEIAARLERIESMVGTVALTRTEVLGLISDLRTLIDLHDGPQVTSPDLADAVRNLQEALRDTTQPMIITALRTLSHYLLGQKVPIEETGSPVHAPRLEKPRPTNSEPAVVRVQVDNQTFNAVAEGLWHALPLSGSDFPAPGDTLILATSSTPERRLYARVERVDQEGHTLVVLGRYPASYGHTEQGEQTPCDYRGVYTSEA